MTPGTLDLHWRTDNAFTELQPPQTLWRQHSDAVNSAWLEARLPIAPAGRGLKTDLFDEALATGLLPMLAGRMRQVVAVDLSTRVFRAARDRHPVLHGAVGDVRALPFEDHTFDWIISNSTLDHFSSRTEIESSLEELHRLLRPNGTLLLTLDNLANPVVALRNALPYPLLRALGLVPYPMGASCGPFRLRQLVSQAGFEVLEMSALLHCPRVLAVAVARLLETRGSARTRARFLEVAMGFERLARSRTRFLSGHFIGVVAIKR